MKIKVNPINIGYCKGVNAVESFKGQPSKELESIISKTVETLCKRVEYEVPEYGKLFKQVEEGFENPDKNAIAQEIKLTVKPSTKKEEQKTRILKMEIFSRDKNSIAPVFELGTKEEIIKKLQDSNILEKIKSEILKADESILKKSRD